MRIVLDTNSLLVSISKKSSYRFIFDCLIDGHFHLIISNEIINEYIEILELKTNHEVASNIGNLLLISPHVEKIVVYFKWGIITDDEDDNKFVDCALNGNADFLVTDDRHFNMLKYHAFPNLKIIRTKEFSKILKVKFS